jgi:hypothetical protein
MRALLRDFAIVLALALPVGLALIRPVAAAALVTLAVGGVLCLWAYLMIFERVRPAASLASEDDERNR